MNNTASLETFLPNPPDKARVLSWVHIGDLHMRAAGEQNDLDLQAITHEINTAFAGSISFVFLPGDNADHGDVAAYKIVRHALDRLQVPWCAIVGDHDVEEKSFANFRAFMAEQTHYSFTVGHVRFLALNAFDVPKPPSFAVLTDQLKWLEKQLHEATAAGQTKVLLLHCYPSDLKQGREQLAELVSRYFVTLIDMGHTHYNEVSHDGKTVYTASRSTGQIEEGPVGFSVINLDAGVVSWRFLELGKLPAIIITSPSDERLLADRAKRYSSENAGLRVRAKVWAKEDVTEVQATFAERSLALHLIAGSNVWEGSLSRGQVSSGVHPLRVTATDARGITAVDEIRVLVGAARPNRERAKRDQDNALAAWPEHGLLGTQLGPNKNGRKW